jgi:transposase
MAVAVFSKVERLADAKHAASYGGLVPSTSPSGEHEAQGRIAKTRGAAEARPPLNPYFVRCARGEATRR